MTGDARVLGSEEDDLITAIAAAEQVDAQELVAELIGQLVALQAARQQERRIRAQRLANVWVPASTEEAF